MFGILAQERSLTRVESFAVLTSIRMRPFSLFIVGVHKFVVSTLTVRFIVDQLRFVDSSIHKLFFRQRLFEYIKFLLDIQPIKILSFDYFLAGRWASVEQFEHRKLINGLKPIIFPFLNRIKTEIEGTEVHKVLQIANLTNVFDLIFGEFESSKSEQIDESIELTDFVDRQIQKPELVQLPQPFDIFDLIAGKVEFSQGKSVKILYLIYDIFGEIKYLQFLIFVQSSYSPYFVSSQFQHSQISMSFQGRNTHDQIAAQVSSIQMKRWVFHIKNRSELIVHSPNFSEMLQSGQAMESLQRVVGKIHFLQEFIGRNRSYCLELLVCAGEINESISGVTRCCLEFREMQSHVQL